MKTALQNRVTAGVCVLTLALLPPVVAVASLFAAPADGPVAAVFPPWWSGADAVSAAWGAGPVVRFGAAPFIVIVAAVDRAVLRRQGAWLLLDPRALGGCADAFSTSIPGSSHDL